jgi:phytoene synthase
MIELERAYQHCEDVTRSRAANFDYGIRLLPPEKRRAMRATYAFARWIDDIGDGALATAEKQRQLAGARAALGALGRGSDDPVMVALADARERFALPLDAMRDLIDGVEMDVVGTGYEQFDELVVYCRRVAGSVGRLCLAIFGARDMARAMVLGDDLGVALQLTNILRDVREDLDAGRVYLPAGDLRLFGCEDLENADPLALAALMRFQVARSRDWLDRGLRLLALVDRRSAACAAAMSGIYGRILDHIEQDPLQVMHRRVSLPAREKAWVATRSLATAGARAGRRGPW